MLNVVVLTTGPLFTLSEAKQHLRKDSSEEDVIITGYAMAAAQRVLDYCDLDLVPVGEGPVAVFKTAALLVLGDLYHNREASPSELPTSATNLLDPYRNLGV
ncbi:head-tail connector protein [Asticcacaulis excentricus]|uniref:Uncharacterized phage protein (Possible DNA packaging) n=1 Tax=Asticcacaulis excentricus (strain ATCC 15261 / DSM 4724 / KCTC 12464 / NCIMB 9791 / VKM B-1370 / CB 48) TaxID=573065 RepID=E8RPQ4_ASTEC|nr:head-tail connector protein [Asticcacaulis excentricus]ADU12031.1 uncharacterized phage protein (possible DNA packaging) [Asticcacaulis excentricus CB 48]